MNDYGIVVLLLDLEISFLQNCWYSEVKCTHLGDMAVFSPGQFVLVWCVCWLRQCNIRIFLVYGTNFCLA